MSEYTGLHIIGDLYDCSFEHISKLHNIPLYFIEIIKNAGFTPLGEVFHVFGENAFTLVIVLSESHFSIHTWPESEYVSVDIFTCNYDRDNSEGAKVIYQRVRSIFSPKKEKTQYIVRERNYF